MRVGIVNIEFGRVGIAATLATLLVGAGLAAVRPLRGQIPESRAPEARLVGLGGSELFLAPHVSLRRGVVRLSGEAVFGRGSSDFSEGRTRLSLRLPRGLVADGSLVLTHRSVGVEGARDRVARVGLRSARAGAWIGLGHDRATAPGFGRDTRSLSLRAWADVGPGLGVTLRRASLQEEVETPLDTTHLILGRYEFHTRRLSRHYREGAYSEVEVDVTFQAGPARLTLVGGHRFEDRDAPAARWGFARATVPVSGAVEVVGELGRNGGLPALGRAPSDFARLGLRVDLAGSRGTGATDDDGFEPDGTGAAAPDPVSSRPSTRPRAEVTVEGDARTLVLTAPGAGRVEVRGDFTDWQPRALEEVAPGRWTHSLQPGIHRLNVRLDRGAWTVPANLPVVPDEFTGAPVAVVVIR